MEVNNLEDIEVELDRVVKDGIDEGINKEEIKELLDSHKEKADKYSRRQL